MKLTPPKIDLTPYTKTPKLDTNIDSLTKATLGVVLLASFASCPTMGELVQVWAPSLVHPLSQPSQQPALSCRLQ